MRIIGTGSYLPKDVLSNDDLSKLVDTNDEWISSRTGIKNRHLTRDENTSDLAKKAAQIALKKAGVLAQDIDLIIVATSTPDTFIPGVAHQVLKQLGIQKAMAFDVNSACTGFIYALDIAASLMQARAFKYALVIGAEVMSKLIDWTDRNTCVLFGDGAGAVVIEHSGKSLLYASCTTIPDEADTLISGGLAVNNPFCCEAQQSVTLKMKGQDVFKFAVSSVYESINEALSETGLSIAEVDYVILHQANQRILDYVAKKLKIANEKLYSNLAHTGNTSAGSIPIAIDEMQREGLLKSGMKIVLTGFGAGLTYGTIILEW